LNPIHHLKYLLKFPGLVVSYQRVIWVVLPDLIHVDCLLNLPALFAARLCGVKTLLHLQEIQGGVIGTVLALVTGRLANRIVAVSEAAARPFRRRAYETKVAVVPNGTGFGNSLPRYNPGGRISFVGRLSRDKDPVLFVRAVQRVYELEPKATFMICGLTVPGRSQYESELFEGIGRSQIPKEKLIICKDLEDVEDMLRNASIVVSCSIAEPFGLSVIEAMALGIPVVVPRSGAFPEIITDSRTGLLYSLGNLDELVSCILTLLRDPSLAERIGNNGRILVRNRFTEENMFSAMERQYNETLNS
jgi:glycosyltransferase involved in cell wall biosynthesis